MRHERRATGRLQIHEVREEPARSGSADLVREREGRAVARGPSGRCANCRMRCNRKNHVVRAVRRVAPAASRAGARCRNRDWRRLRTRRCRETTCDGQSRHSHRGRCRTSWRVWCSPSSCIAPGRSGAASRITSNECSSAVRLGRIRWTVTARDGARVTDTIVVTESLGGSPLSRAGRAGELPQWFVPRPTTPAEWKRHARTRH